jgi:hypothetical protein
MCNNCVKVFFYLLLLLRNKWTQCNRMLHTTLYHWYFTTAICSRLYIFSPCCNFLFYDLLRLHGPWRVAFFCWKDWYVSLSDQYHNQMTFRAECNMTGGHFEMFELSVAFNYQSHFSPPLLRIIQSSLHFFSIKCSLCCLYESLTVSGNGWFIMPILFWTLSMFWYIYICVCVCVCVCVIHRLFFTTWHCKIYIILCFWTQLYETFTDTFIHLVNLFVALGNAVLSKKMASYTTVQELFFIKTLYSSGGACVESSLFVSRHPETLSIGLLNSLKKRKECVINVRRA